MLDITRIRHLALQLGYPVEYLHRLAKHAHHMYGRVEIPKSDDNIRLIEPPFPDLKSVQRRIKDRLLDKIPLPDNIHSYRKGRSIKNNAQPHIGHSYMLKTDIDNFFPSITNKDVYRLFMQLGCSPDVSSILTKLTTVNGHVPQGSPTSQHIANLILIQIVKRINNHAEKHGFAVTFYGDDITISGWGLLAAFGRKHGRFYRKIIQQCGYGAKLKKTFLLLPSDKKLVTGIEVTEEGLTKDKAYIDNIEAEIGSIKDNGITDSKKRSLKGKIQHVKDVNLQTGRKLKRNFNKQLYGKK